MLPPNEHLASDLVWAVQQEVIQSLLEDKNNFILSLDPYKTNHETVKRWEQCQFLSSLFETLQSNDSSVLDINIVPMSISYDLTIEDLFTGNTSPLLKRSISQWAKFVLKLFCPGNNGCGRVRIDFDQPFSLLEFMKNKDKYSTRPEACDNDAFTINLTNHALWSSFNLRRFSACDIYSFVKLNKPSSDLEYSVEKLATDIKRKNRDFAFSGNSVAVTKYASRLLNKHRGGVKRLANNVLQVYLGEMVMATAVCGLLKTVAISCYIGTHAQIFVGSKQDILEEAKLLLNLVEYEFPLVTPPCKENVDYFLMESLDHFIGKTLEVKSRYYNKGMVLV